MSLPTTVCTIVIIVGFIIIGIKRNKSRRISPANTFVDDQKLNTNTHNKSVLSSLGTLFVSAGVMFIALPSFLLTRFGDLEKRDLIMFYIVVLYDTLIIFLPLIYFLKSPNKMKRVFEHIRS